MVKITPTIAAYIMKKNVQFVRIGLQRGLLPFGVAMQRDEGRKRCLYNYYISPKQFMDFTGATMADIMAARRALGLEA